MKKVILIIAFGLVANLIFSQNTKKTPTFKEGVEINHGALKKERGQTVLRKNMGRKHLTATEQTLRNNDKSIQNTWDVQFQHDVEIGSGIATNGSSFFVSQWNNDTIYVYNLSGNLTSKHKITVTGIRDLTYDGSFFYGSNTSNKIYKMNFSNFTVVDSIVCPAYISVRHIAYDNNVNAFWVGNWDTDIYLVSHSGQVLNTISAFDHELYGMYGSAYDNVTPGGPYLWLFDQGGSGCDIVMIKISTGKQTGVINDCYDDVASDLFEPIAGGLFIYNGLVPGTVTLGGIVQRQRIFGYNLASLVATNDVGVEAVLSPILYSGCTLGGQENISIRLRNFGLNATSYFTAHMVLNNTTYTVNISTPINSFETLDVTFPGTFNFSQPNMYKMVFYTNYGYDNNTANDTGYYNIITGNGLITVDILTDDYPDETYWEVYNNFTWDVYGSSWGMPMMPNTLYSTDVCVDTTLCYGFTIFDTYGDGIFSPGYYEVFFNNLTVAYNDSFTSLFEETPYIGHCNYADIGVVGIMSPVSSCFLSDEEFVTVIIKNYGTQTISNASVVCLFDGITYSEPASLTLQSQEEGQYTFVNTFDMSGLGNHTLQIYTEHINDMNPFNDTVKLVVENYVPAQTPYNVTFDDLSANAQLLVEDENMDYFTWGLYNNGGINNSYCAIYSFNPNEAANDWLFTKCMNLMANQTYYLNFYTKAQSTLYPESMKVHLAQAPSSSAVASPALIDLSSITDTTYAFYTVPFNVDDFGSGSYYIGFNAYSNLGAWNLFLDNISVTNTASIEGNNNNSRLIIFPNPANDKLNVNIIENDNNASDKTIYIYNLHGQILYKQASASHANLIDVSPFQNGVYIIRIESETNSLFKKFIKY